MYMRRTPCGRAIRVECSDRETPSRGFAAATAGRPPLCRVWIGIDDSGFGSSRDVQSARSRSSPRANSISSRSNRLRRNRRAGFSDIRVTTNAFIERFAVVESRGGLHCGDCVGGFSRECKLSDRAWFVGHCCRRSRFVSERFVRVHRIRWSACDCRGLPVLGH